MAKELPQSLHDRKTETDAARISRGDLVIFFEDLSDVLSWNSDAAVPDFNASLVCSATTADQNPPLISVAYRIRNKITDHFFEHPLVTTNHKPRRNDAEF